MGGCMKSPYLLHLAHLSESSYLRRWRPVPRYLCYLCLDFQAMLVNSAYSLTGSSVPDAFSGFGRIQLENVMPLNGEGDMNLFVADAMTTDLDDYTVDEYSFKMNGSTGMEFRATLAWIDPPASSLSGYQLVNDLDLAVYSPSGVKYTMWDYEPDSSNVIERVVIPASVDAAENGTWIVAVSALSLSDVQPYSLVVTGAFDVESGGVTNSAYSGAALRAVPVSFWPVVLATACALVAALWTI